MLEILAVLTYLALGVYLLGCEKYSLKAMTYGRYFASVFGFLTVACWFIERIAEWLASHLSNLSEPQRAWGARGIGAALMIIWGVIYTKTTRPLASCFALGLFLSGAYILMAEIKALSDLAKFLWPAWNFVGAGIMLFGDYPKPTCIHKQASQRLQRVFLPVFMSINGVLSLSR